MTITPTSSTPATTGRPDVTTKLTVPADMHDAMAARAHGNRRTLNAELVALIQRGMLVANPVDKLVAGVVPARRRADQLASSTTLTPASIADGALAVEQLHGDVQQRTTSATVDQLLDAAFHEHREPRSAEYRAGARAALAFRIEGMPIHHVYPASSAQDDAFTAGIAEGHAIWRRAVANGAV